MRETIEQWKARTGKGIKRYATVDTTPMIERVALPKGWQDGTSLHRERWQHELEIARRKDLTRRGDSPNLGS